MQAVEGGDSGRAEGGDGLEGAGGNFEPAVSALDVAADVDRRAAADGADAEGGVDGLDLDALDAGEEAGLAVVADGVRGVEDQDCVAAGGLGGEMFGIVVIAQGGGRGPCCPARCEDWRLHLPSHRRISAF